MDANRLHDRVDHLETSVAEAHDNATATIETLRPKIKSVLAEVLASGDAAELLELIAAKVAESNRETTTRAVVGAARLAR